MMKKYIRIFGDKSFVENRPGFLLKIPTYIISELEKDWFFIYRWLKYIAIYSFIDNCIEEFYERSKYFYFLLVLIFVFYIYYDYDFDILVIIIWLFGTISFYLLEKIINVTLFLIRLGDVVFIRWYLFYDWWIFEYQNWTVNRRIFYKEKSLNYLSSEVLELQYDFIEEYLFSLEKHNFLSIFSVFWNIFKKYFPNNRTFSIIIFIPIFIPVFIIFNVFYIFWYIIFYLKNLIFNFNAIYVPYIFKKLYNNLNYIKKRSKIFSNDIYFYGKYNKNIEKIWKSIKNIIKIKDKLLKLSEHNIYLETLLKKVVIEKMTEIFDEIHTLLWENIKHIRQKQKEVLYLDNPNIKLLSKRLDMTFNNLKTQQRLISDYRKKLEVII